MCQDLGGTWHIVYMGMGFLEEESQNVVEVSVNHQGEEEYHTDNLNTLHKLVAGFAASNHFE